MATLYVRGMPDDLYEQLKRQAMAEGRSIGQEAVRAIRLGLLATRTGPDPRLAAWLRNVRRQRARWAREGRKFPDSAALIREDRQR